MFVFLSKLAPIFVYPLGLACVLLILALFVFRRPRWRKIALGVALLVLWFGGNRWVALSLARSLEWRYLPPEHLPQAEVIVLLGGGTTSAGTPRSMVEINTAGDRILYAAWLYREETAPYILLTGGPIGWDPVTATPAEQMASVLELIGVPAEALWLEGESRNTYENAQFSAQILRDKGIDRILLVTSASHMHRSVKLFEAQDLEVVPMPTDYSLTQADWDKLGQGSLESQVLGVFPSAGNLALTTRILKEYIGIFVYTLRGWQ